VVVVPRAAGKMAAPEEESRLVGQGEEVVMTEVGRAKLTRLQCSQGRCSQCYRG
jgi:hypothetical protein